MGDDDISCNILGGDVGIEAEDLLLFSAYCAFGLLSLCCCIAPVVWANWTLTTRVIAHESRAGRLRGEGGSALQVDQGPVFISWGMMGDR